jgi:hypothetical protein
MALIKFCGQERKLVMSKVMFTLARVAYFHVDVTFEMRTAIQSNAFIQLVFPHKIKSSFISEMKEGAKGKMAERQRESERESTSVGQRWYSVGCKWTIRKYTCLINKLVNIWYDCYYLSR